MDWNLNPVSLSILLSSLLSPCFLLSLLSLVVGAGADLNLSVLLIPPSEYPRSFFLYELISSELFQWRKLPQTIGNVLCTEGKGDRPALARQVKVLAVKPNHLSSIPGIHKVEEKNAPLTYIHTVAYMQLYIRTYMYTHIHKYINIICF